MSIDTPRDDEADEAAAAAAPRRDDARARARNAAVARHVHAAAVRLRRRRRAARGVVDARRLQPVGRRSRQGSPRRRRRRRPQRAAVRAARPQGRRRLGVLRSRGAGAVGGARDQARAARRARGHRRVPVRVHGPRPLRHHRGRRSGERSDGRAARARRRVARGRRRRHRRAVGHDGRARRRDPPGARRARLREHGDHGVRGEVLLGVLRSVPRGRGFGAEVRRSAVVPDGSGERGRGAARGRAGHRGRRRHRHGEAGAALPRRALAREDASSATRRRRTR